MDPMKRGLLITFEGVEGSGKTTQAKHLAQWFAEKSVPYEFVREPGGTDIGEMIRSILLNPDLKVHPKCEALLFLAARSQVVHDRILPALKQKKTVIVDRFSDSTYAYQVCGRGLPERLVHIVNRFACAGLTPDLTILVDIDTSRRHERGKNHDRMEREDDSYHQKVRRAYLQLARRAKKRIKVLDGEKSVEELKSEVLRHVQDLLNRKGYTL